MRICSGQPPRRASRLDERRDRSINNTGAVHRRPEFAVTIGRDSKNNTVSRRLWRFFPHPGSR
jgi:hypothetical protein